MSSKAARASRQAKIFSRFFVARTIASLVVLLAFYWLGDSSGLNNLSFLQYTVALWVGLTLSQLAVMLVVKENFFHIFIQLVSDLILIGFVIYGSGGLASPFIFLLGLVIIVAGGQAQVLLTLITTVLAASIYVATAYYYAHINHLTIGTPDTLKLLLQTSLFFLTGGIMALIAKRHRDLQRQESLTSNEHKHLKEIHSQVLNVMHEGIIILNQDLTIQTFNPSAAILLGMSEQHIGFKIDSFLQLPPSLLSHSSTHKMVRHETKLNNQHLLLSFSSLRDETGESWLMTIVDITETRELERQLAEQDKLASIGQMAAMLAHEIRNPMQTISQAVELMGIKTPNSKLEKIVTDEISRLNRLVSDMLDYANPLHPKPTPSNISEIIQASIQQIDLNNACQIQTRIVNANTLEIDPDHIRLILDNLLRNAVRVSPNAQSITVCFSIENGKWCLTVKDQGPGIDKKIKERLFHPFQTGHKKGTGLGLATVWQVCLINQWQVAIDPDYTEGACFIVSGNIAPSLTNAGVEHG